MRAEHRALVPLVELLQRWNASVARALASRWIGTDAMPPDVAREIEFNRRHGRKCGGMSELDILEAFILRSMPAVSLPPDGLLDQVSRPMTNDDREALLRTTLRGLAGGPGNVVYEFGMAALKADGRMEGAKP